jgi:hypothetical protein
LQITALALLRHRPLKLQQTRMLKKHHGKSTHQRVGKHIAALLGHAAIGHRAKSGPQQLDKGF